MKQMIVAAAALTALALPAAAFAQAQPAVQSQPVGRIEFTGGSVAAGIGYSWGSGTLTYKGKTYKIKVDGFNVGDVGVVSVDAAGDVYNLTKISDFDGNYAAAGIGATLAGGGSVMTMQNPHGVVIHVWSTTTGLRLHLGPSGINMRVAQQ